MVTKTIENMTTERETIWSSGEWHIVKLIAVYEFEDGSQESEDEGLLEVWRVTDGRMEEAHWVDLPEDGQKVWGNLI